MKAVFRHELSSYFTNVTAYVFGAFMLLFVGIYTLIYNINAGYASFEYVPGNMCFIYIIIIPILTMRVLAEEKHAKTDTLLYSLPVSMGKVITGKYLAMLVMLLIPSVIMGLYPLILSSYGGLYIPGALSSVAGFFLLGAALLAIGMFVSSLTESQAVAAGVCFLVMLLNYFLSSLAGLVSSSAVGSVIAFTIVIILVALVIWFMTRSWFAACVTGIILEIILLAVWLINADLLAGLFPSVISQLSLFERFNVFVGNYAYIDNVGGVFDITGVVYYITVIALFLFLSVQAMERKRWSE